MSKYELFCMIFYVLDAEWDESNNAELGQFLSGANPFLFKETGSADPAIYQRFCEIVPNAISVENSYSIARKYICSLHNKIITSSFLSIDEAEWKECVKEYLSRKNNNN